MFQEKHYFNVKYLLLTDIGAGLVKIWVLLLTAPYVARHEYRISINGRGEERS